MSVVVGTLSVDLVARTAAFQGDLGKAAQGARGSFNDIKRSSADAANGMNTNFGEARHALMMIGEEFGVHLPRGITSFITHIGPLGAMLEAAFPYAAIALGATLLIEKLMDTGEAAKKAAEEAKKLNEELMKSSDEARKSWVDTNNAIQLVGATGSKKFSTQERQKQDQIDQTNKKLRDYQDQLYAINQGMRSGDAEFYKHQIELTKDDVSKLTNELELLKVEFKDSSEDEATKRTNDHAAAMMKLGNAILFARQQAAKAPDGMISRTDTIPGDPMAGLPDIMKGAKHTKDDVLYSGSESAKRLADIVNDQATAIKRAQEITAEYATDTQKLDIVQQELGILLGEGRITWDQYKQAMAGAKSKLDESQKAWKELGQNIGETIQAAMLFGRSWTDALKAILVELVQVILQMTVLKKMKDSMGSGSGGGGFLTTFLGSLFGGKHADGGTIPAGTWGIAGEAGPEWIYGGVAGVSVVPGASSHSSSQATVIYNIDARGADPASAARIERALKQTEDRAVARATASIYESRMRNLN